MARALSPPVPVRPPGRTGTPASRLPTGRGAGRPPGRSRTLGHAVALHGVTKVYRPGRRTVTALRGVHVTFPGAARAPR